MPEGDTVHKLANYLAPRLEGQRLVTFDMGDALAARRCQGQRIRRVFAHGKHLFFELENALLVRSHLGMYGDWHRYSPGEAWRKPAWRASVTLATEDAIYVCFNAKEVELVPASSVRRRVLEGRLGPDLLGDGIDFDRIVERAREMLPPETPLIDVLLDQRVAAGIGNVYKSEILFIEHYPPLTPRGDLADERLRRLFVLAAELLSRNLGGGPRVTRFERDAAGRTWVYGRRGLPCLRCDAQIESARLGRDHRSTSWCPSCQRAGSSTADR